LISGFGAIKTGGGAGLIRRAKHKSVKVACGPLRAVTAIAEEIAVLRGHEKIVASVAFSPRIVTASEDKTARIWDAAAKDNAVLRGS
jgi:WD40 repeat protein